MGSFAEKAGVTPQTELATGLSASLIYLGPSALAADAA